MAKSTRIIEVRFPQAGVNRRLGVHDSSMLRAPYPTPWSVNVRPEDALANRIRGGSRPGLTKFLANPIGTAVTGIVSVPTASVSGASAKLAVVADEALGVLDGTTLSTPTGDMLTEASDILQTEGGDDILADTGGVPASCFLAARRDAVYGIASTGIVSMNLSSGIVDVLTASKGTVPSGVTFGCVWRDRLVLAGGDNAIFMSRQGDPTDWDYGADVGDAGRAIAFQAGESQEIGDTCTALVPFKDTNLLVATQFGLWMVQGDPAAAGSLRNIARGIGMIGPRAWCLVEDARIGDSFVRYGIVFLGEDGLYLIAPTGDGLRSITHDSVPLELIDIPDTSTVTLAYSPEDRGVFVFATPVSGVATHWFYDLAQGGIWPIRLQEDHQPLSACWHEGDILMAGQDGYLRYLGGDSDDGDDIGSHLLIGPIRAAGAGTFGRILSLMASLAAGSGAVTWRIVTGETAENACDRGKLAIEAFQVGTPYTAYVAASGSLAAGRNGVAYPRVRSEWFCLWLESSDKWGYETAIIEIDQSGRVR